MAVSKSNIRAICDAGPIIHLDELNCLDLLCDFQQIVLGDTVLEEVKHHRPGALKKPNIHFMRSPQEYPVSELLRTMCRIFSLDAGEIETLAIIEKNPGALFFTDDASARLVADRMGFNSWNDRHYCQSNTTRAYAARTSFADSCGDTLKKQFTYQAVFVGKNYWEGKERVSSLTLFALSFQLLCFEP